MPKKPRCIVCGSTLLEPLYNPGSVPISCLDICLKGTVEEAKEVPKYPMDYHECQVCGHIFNTSFDPQVVEYENGSTIMYNTTPIWQSHIRKTGDSISKYAYDKGSNKTVIIGSGDGSLLHYMRDDLMLDVIGFEPGVTASKNVVSDYFIPERDLPIYKPNLIICRHVLEHLADPREFLVDLTRYCKIYNQNPYLYFEVPSFEKAYTQGRVCDLVYGHVSNFTTESLGMVFELSGMYVIDNGSAFNEEVLWVVAKPCDLDRGVVTYNKMAAATIDALSVLKNLVVWGGSGKCASFLNMYKLLKAKVVDSDTKKHGKHVPGVGTLIESPTIIQSCDNIVIPNVWRARDIYQEIQKNSIPYKQIFVPLEGKLYEYTKVADRL